jgi:hypothetical protein
VFVGLVCVCLQLLAELFGAAWADGGGEVGDGEQGRGVVEGEADGFAEVVEGEGWWGQGGFGVSGHGDVSINMVVEDFLSG